MSKVVQVRDVPTDVHAVLVQRASRRGLSLSAYVRELLEREAQRPTLEEALSRVGGLAPHISMDEVVSIVREMRDDT